MIVASLPALILKVVRSKSSVRLARVEIKRELLLNWHCSQPMLMVRAINRRGKPEDRYAVCRKCWHAYSLDKRRAEVARNLFCKKEARILGQRIPYSTFWLRATIAALLLIALNVLYHSIRL